MNLRKLMLFFLALTSSIAFGQHLYQFDHGLGSGYFKHDGPVAAPGMSPDKNTLYTASEKNIFVWDREKAKITRIISKAKYGIERMVCSPVENKIAIEDTC